MGRDLDRRIRSIGRTGYVFSALGLLVSSSKEFSKPEDHWSCIAHLSAEDMLKSAVIEEKKLKRRLWAGADNPLGPKF